MDAEFTEKYDKLSDMRPGDTAISKDREKFFVCGYHRDKLMDKAVFVILDVNRLHDQYTDKRDMSQPIKILKRGDKFNFKI